MKYLSLIFFISLKVYSLEIDEKLTLRFLKVSDSKKTVLINRGGEDGIIVGDHAKFFITSGVIARGVVEKVSPQRSIWSLYRIIDNSEITEGKVLNLKIATPAKITTDPSKSLKEEIIPGGSEKMEMDELKPQNAKISEKNKVENDEKEDEELLDPENNDGSKEGKKEIKEEGHSSEKNISSNKEFEEDKKIKEEKNTKKVIENNFEQNYNDISLYGILGLQSLSGTSNSSDSETENSTASVESMIDIKVGISKVFFDKFSASLFIHSKKVENGTEVKLTHSYLDFGSSFSYYFVSPRLVKKPIYNLIASIGMGKTTLKSVTTSGGSSTEAINKGSSFNYAFGFGIDYFFIDNFGLKSILEYQINREKISYENDVTNTQNLSGPSINLGVIYKF